MNGRLMSRKARRRTGARFRPGDAGRRRAGRLHRPHPLAVDDARRTARRTCARRVNAGMPATAEIDAAYRAGLDGLERASHVVLLTWLDRAPRNLIVQKPRHSPRTSGTFALRSPARPNPIGLHVARLVSIDRAGRPAHARCDRCARRHAADRFEAIFRLDRIRSRGGVRPARTDGRAPVASAPSPRR